MRYELNRKKSKFECKHLFSTVMSVRGQQLPVTALRTCNKTRFCLEEVRTLSGYRSLSAILCSHDELALLALSPVDGWQSDPPVPAVHVNPEQQGVESVPPHCCP